MTPAIRIIIFLVIYMAIINSAAVSAQSVRDLDSIPIQNRESFNSRFNEVFEYQKNAQWGKLYDLLENPQQSKDEYLKWIKDIPSSLTLIDFEMYSVGLIYQGANQYYIKGCAHYLNEDKKNVFLESDSEAKYKNNNWYILPIGVTILPAGGMKVCRFKKQVINN